MKILHIALGSPEFDRAFQDAGHEVLRYEWRMLAGRKPGGDSARYLNAQILAKFDAFQPDLVWMQIQTPGVMLPDVCDIMRERAVVLNWTGDVRDDIGWYKQLAPHVSATLFTNGTDVDAMRADGLRADYLQIGYDQRIYHLPKKQVFKRSGIAFLGNNYNGRFPESHSRAAMVQAFMEEFGPAVFKVYGRGWPDSHVATAVDEVKIYHNALVALNWDHYHRPYFASDRILRAQACGACVVTRNYSGCEDEHPSVFRADSIHEMVYMCKGLLQTPGITESMGAQQAEWVRQHHTWDARVPRIIELYNEYK